MDYKEIERIIKETIPKECGLSKIEFLGVNVVIYLRNIKRFYDSDQLIKKIASKIRKKIIIRTAPESLMPIPQAMEKIKSLLPKELEVTSIKFVPEFSEVRIESLKPGLVIGKGGQLLKQIMLETGWAAIALRTPTMTSATIKGLRAADIADAEYRKKFLSSVGKRICQNTVKTRWGRTVFLGGFREVGRSSMLVQTPNSKILIDVGINPVTMDPSKAFPALNLLGFPLEELDAVIITHAHMDHVGFLPYLFRYGYNGPVYMTPPTKDLAVLLQQDYIDLVKKTFGVNPPYTKKDIQKEIRHIITLNYEEVVDITPEVKLILYNAGHILGSSMVHLHIGGGTHNMLHTGDMKFGFTRLLDPAKVTFPRVETVFIESTYGGKNDYVPSRAESDKRLMEVIKETISKKGKVLIPVFAVGRSQEILLVLEEFFRKNPDFSVPIYIDGMVREASAIHTAYPEFLKESLKRRILSNQSPFESELIKVAKGENRYDIVDGEPCVILAPSGMLAGGPSYEYLKLMAEDEKNTIIFVGYQSPLSLGYKIQQGVKEIPIIGEDGKTKVLNIKMRVETVEGFSGHSSRPQLMAFLKNLTPTPNRVFMMHGNWNKTEEFARAAAQMLKRETRAPLNYEAIRLF